MIDSIPTNVKIGFTCSDFDLLHAGHILMLEECKTVCDYLIVGLQTDPTIDRGDVKTKPVQGIFERYIQLEAVKYVDKIVVYDTENELKDLLQILPINVRICGQEYKNKKFTGLDICEQKGIELYFNSRNNKFNTTELRQRAHKVETFEIMKNKVLSCATTQP